MADDPRLTDEATGLPPIDELDPEASMVTLAWATSDGIVAHADDETVPVRFLHLRGIAIGDDGVPLGAAQWVQIHVAIPTEHAMDLAAELVGGVDV